ncbi:LOW QUALITY PROTEIN: transcription elongation factor, mitochondrial [Drosophila gunungcola]|uniref:LOW QUALITY PROTEIN: transcription elongation factor, mitochondrial n=1 Tax=Drosophila gunungcola TaxID=103775 RepID=UPI0022E3BD30|nr:LOW QUALITY PROTEIN: transcription elongation factor, mitochondrial [Drosophila gunungcola]
MLSRRSWLSPYMGYLGLSSRLQHGARQAENDQPSGLLPAYSDAERMKILQAINENGVDQMTSFDITKARAAKLHSWKTRHGPLQDLGDILCVEGFGLKVATKFFKSLLEPLESRSSGVVGKKRKAARVAPFITPAIDEAQRLRIISTVGVRIGVTSVSWARLEIGSSEAPCTLTDWHHHELNDKKLHLSELTRRCLYVSHQIPQADCYVLESPQMAQASSNPGSIDQQNVNIQKAQVAAIMSYSLMSRSDAEEDKANSLFFMRRFLSARLFNHLVGTERVSSEDTILAMMRTYSNVKDELPSTERSLHNEVHFPADLRHAFSQQERYQRELLGQAFLLSLAFTRLVLLQDPQSIDSVSRSSKGSLPGDEGCEVGAV